MENFEQTSLIDLESYEQPDVEYQDINSLPEFGEDVEENYTESKQTEDSDSYLTSFLKNYGINRNRIKFANEDGTEEEVSFDDLTDEEKLDLMLGLQTPVMSDEELRTINYLRTNRLNLADFAEAQKQQAIKEYLEQNKSVQYSVDALSDRELYILELHDNYPDLTNEEIIEETDKAMENEALFQKKITAIRNSYKEAEDQQIKEREEEQSRQAAQEWDDFAENMVNVARNTGELHNLLLDDDDKEEVLSYLLDKDGNGQTEFIKLLSDPEALFRLAWYAVKGKEAFIKLDDYYKSQISQSRRQAAPQAPKVVKRAPQRNSPSKENATVDLDSYFG